MKAKIYLVLLIALFLGCKNPAVVLESSTPPVSVDFSISEAQAAYNAELSDNRAEKGRKNKSEKTSKRKVRWEEAEERYRNDGSKTLMVPFTLDEDVYIKLDDSLMVPYSDLTELRASKVNGKYEFEVVTEIPDKECIRGNPDLSFSGWVFVEDINGNLKETTYTKNGKVAYGTRVEPGARAATAVCLMGDKIDWYSCPVVDGHVIYHSCQFMYTEDVCYAWGTTGSTGGTGGSGGTVTNGSTAGGVYIVGGPVYVNKIKWCNFNFQPSAQNEFWQAATIKNYTIALVRNSANPVASTENIRLTLDYGFPTWSDYLGYRISAEEAALEASAATYAAVIDVATEYNWASMTSAQIATKIAELTQQKLNDSYNFMGPVIKVSTQGGTNGGGAAATRLYNRDLNCPEP